LYKDDKLEKLIWFDLIYYSIFFYIHIL
jgi:hypothetical protein